MSCIGREAPRADRERRLALMLGLKQSSEPWSSSKELLRRARLRPTRQRMALASILFARGDRHVTAEMLHHEAVQADVPVSLATVYNTLHQFTEAGLLRRIGVDGSRSFFDTNLTGHHHFFVQDEEVLLDIPASMAVLDRLPEPPAGYEIMRVDVVVRLSRVQA